MNTPEFIKWPLAQNLAYRIVERLDGFSEVIEDKSRKSIQITGYLQLGNDEFSTKKKARCIFEVGSRWIYKIPEVACHEPWVIKRMPEWHADTNGRLCFEFDLKWERELTEMVEQFTYGLTANYATKWLLNSTRWLLNRHLFAFRNGIATWPKSWDYWAHTKEAAKQQMLENQEAFTQ